MILRDNAHDYLLMVLGSASDRRFSTLIDFIEMVGRDELKQVIEKAKELVEKDVPKKYHRTVARALSNISETWWQTIENPPEWLARATYLYVLSETLGDATGFPIVYRRLLEPEKMARHLPLYISYGVHTTVLVNPTKRELARELSRENVTVDSTAIEHILKLVAERHMKVDVNNMVADLLGRRIYYDEDSFLTLLSFMGMNSTKEELIARAVQRDVVSGLSHILGLDEKASQSVYSYANEVRFNLPASAIWQRYPEVRNLLSDVKVYLQLSTRRLAVVRLDLNITLATGNNFTVTYSIEPPVKLADCPHIILEKLDSAVKSILKLHEEMTLLKRLGESTGIENAVIHYRVHGYFDNIELSSSISGEVKGNRITIDYDATIDGHKSTSRRITSKLYFDLESKHVARLLMPSDLRDHLAYEGVEDADNIEVDIRRNRKSLKVLIKHSDPIKVPESVSTAVRVVSDYLAKLRESSSRRSLGNELAVAIYLYAGVYGGKSITKEFGRQLNEVLMKVGRLLSTLDPTRYSSIRSTLNNRRQKGYTHTLLDAFYNVVDILIDSGYLTFDSNGRIIINGRQFTDVVKEGNVVNMSPSDIDTIEYGVLLELLRYRTTAAKVISRMVQATDRLPDKVARILVSELSFYDTSFILTPIAGKPLAAYLPEDAKRSIANKLDVSYAVEILTTPEYEKYFSEAKDILLNRVLSSLPDAVTAYAYRTMPELFDGVQVTKAHGISDHVLECGRWYCQVGRLDTSGRGRHVFILYRKDARVGVAFVARNLAEALEKAEAQYDEGLKVINLISTSKPALASLGLEFDKLELYRWNLVLPMLYRQREEHPYYITPTGGTRLLDMLKEQEEAVATDA